MPKQDNIHMNPTPLQGNGGGGIRMQANQDPRPVRPPDPPDPINGAPPPLTKDLATMEPSSLNILFHESRKPSSPRAAQKSFASLLAAPNLNLQPRLPTLHKGKPTLFYSKAEIQPILEQYKYALVGKFSYHKPALLDIRNSISKMGLKGCCEVSLLRPGYIFINLTVEEDMFRFRGRPEWIIAGAPMRIFRWSPDFRYDVESPLVAIWIEIPGLPVWTLEETILFSMAASVGKPLKVDDSTYSKHNKGKARIWVEVDLTKELKSEIVVFLDDESWELPVWYGYVPSYCLYCKHVGHDATECYVNPNSSTYQLDTSKPKEEKPHTDSKRKDAKQVPDLRNLLNQKKSDVDEPRQEWQVKGGKKKTSNMEQKKPITQGTQNKEITLHNRFDNIQDMADGIGNPTEAEMHKSNDAARNETVNMENVKEDSQKKLDDARGKKKTEVASSDTREPRPAVSGPSKPSRKYEVDLTNFKLIVTEKLEERKGSISVKTIKDIVLEVLLFLNNKSFVVSDEVIGFITRLTNSDDIDDEFLTFISSTSNGDDLNDDEHADCLMQSINGEPTEREGDEFITKVDVQGVHNKNLPVEGINTSNQGVHNSVQAVNLDDMKVLWTNDYKFRKNARVPIAKISHILAKEIKFSVNQFDDFLSSLEEKKKSKNVKESAHVNKEKVSENTPAYIIEIGAEHRNLSPRCETNVHAKNEELHKAEEMEGKNNEVECINDTEYANSRSIMTIDVAGTPEGEDFTSESNIKGDFTYVTTRRKKKNKRSSK